ncbi:MAG: lactate racemase domain-containing protein [Bacillota bacterium]
MKKVCVPSRRWYENTPRELCFPNRWNVEKLIPAGHLKPGLSLEKITNLINNPQQGPTLAALAAEKKEAVIVFDDMTRATPTYEIVPGVIEVLNNAGITDEHIRFVWALGSHGTYDMSHARKKLGADIVRRFSVYNHDAFNKNNNLKAGVSREGVEIFLNREYMQCDLKIGIESMFPHIQAGWSGGGKLIVPGIASIETIENFHKSQFRDIEQTGFGRWKHNPMVSVFNQAAELSKLDYKFDCLINDRGGIADLFCGSPQDTYAEGVKHAPAHYALNVTDKYDIVIANSYAKASESAISYVLATQIVKKDGVIVLLLDAPEGQVYHYLLGAWGTDYGGNMYHEHKAGETKNFVRRLILNMAYPDNMTCGMICHRHDAEIIESWEDVLKSLEADYSDGASVAVINDGTMQCFTNETIC